MTIKGNPVSPGIAIGEVYLYRPFSPVVEKAHIDCADVEANVARYNEAKRAAAAELGDIVAKLESGDPDKAKIFLAHQSILDDVAMEEEILELISDELFTADYAVSEIYGRYVAVFEAIEDELIRERAADLKDVCNRLLRCFAGEKEKNLAQLESDAIVVAHDLFPSDTATLDRQRVLAILTEVGGPTSHSAIIARSYEIPAVLGIPDVMERLRQGERIIVDAIEGKVITQPGQNELEDYATRIEAYRAKVEQTKRYLNVEPLTACGVRVDIHMNVGSASKQELDGSAYTDGVGLFRTEFLYMGRDKLPSEDEQYCTYKKVLETFGRRPVMLRTLDIGGDKQLKSIDLPKEDNPFLGNRALRLCFTYPDIFKTQLRAALRASVHGNLWIMLPMVACMEDIRRSKAMLEEVKSELNSEGITIGEYKLGIMIEIPSIAIIADIAAKEVDFASIGSNDLCQYLMATDRMNPILVDYYQSMNPAMFRLIGNVIEQFALQNKPVSVCGEMGGDPLSAAVLIGLGMRKLSMGIASVAQIKKLLAGLTIEKAQELAQTVKMLSTAHEVSEYLMKELSGLI